MMLRSPFGVAAALRPAVRPMGQALRQQNQVDVSGHEPRFRDCYPARPLRFFLGSKVALNAPASAVRDRAAGRQFWRQEWGWRKGS